MYKYTIILLKLGISVESALEPQISIIVYISHNKVVE